MKEIESAFESTSILLFGKKLDGNLDDYAEWLKRGFPSDIRSVKSIASDKQVTVAPVVYYSLLGGNIMTLDESLEHGKLSLSTDEVDKLNLENATTTLSKIKSTTPEIIWGQNIGTEGCACYGPTKFCYKSSFVWFTNKAAYSFMPRTSEVVFGCSNVLDCMFSMRCFNSAKLTRCFEVSDSNNCKDSYFCFNCENLENCMFCFNTKSRRYAVGNVEIGRENYMKIRKILLDALAKELSEKKSFRFGVLDVLKG